MTAQASANPLGMMGPAKKGSTGKRLTPKNAKLNVNVWKKRVATRKEEINHIVVSEFNWETPIKQIGCNVETLRSFSQTRLTERVPG